MATLFFARSCSTTVHPKIYRVAANVYTLRCVQWTVNRAQFSLSCATNINFGVNEMLCTVVSQRTVQMANGTVARCATHSSLWSLVLRLIESWHLKITNKRLANATLLFVEKWVNKRNYGKESQQSDITHCSSEAIRTMNDFKTDIHITQDRGKNGDEVDGRRQHRSR